jgi:cell division transport system permease protein
MNYRGLKRSFIDFKRHPWLHFVSISTIAVSLVILGVFFLCYRNFDSLAERTSNQSTGTVYLKDALKEADINRLREKILGLPYVQRVLFKTKASIMEDLQSFLGSATVETMPGNELFPDVLEISIRKDATPGEVGELRVIISKYSEVAEVDFSEDWLTQFRKVRQFFRIGGALLIFGIVIGCGFMIANFMGMRHQARKREIEIVRLIGASQRFVLAPFLWEGTIEGVLGTGVALLGLYGLEVIIAAVISVQWASLLGVKELLYLSPVQLLCIFGLGMTMAFFGSITVFLRFQENGTR